MTTLVPEKTYRGYERSFSIESDIEELLNTLFNDDLSFEWNDDDKLVISDGKRFLDTFEFGNWDHVNHILGDTEDDEREDLKTLFAACKESEVEWRNFLEEDGSLTLSVT